MKNLIFLFFHAGKTIRDLPGSSVRQLEKLESKPWGGPQPLEIETPVSKAAVKETEFAIKVAADGQTTLTVVEGIVEIGTAF